MRKFTYVLAALFLIVNAEINCQTFPTGIEEYYSFDESSGQAIDAVGGLNSSSVNATQGVAGKISTCYEFNGTSNMVTFPDHSNWTINTSDNFSVSVWVMLTGQITANGYGNIWGHQDGPQVFLHTTSTTGNYEIGWWTGGTSAITSPIAFSLNTWYHIVVTKSGSSVTFYRNNAAVGSATANDVDANPSDVFVGGDDHSTNEAFNGRIDELGIWKKELTAGEVTQLYNSGSGLTYPLLPPDPVDYVNIMPVSPMNLTSAAAESSITINSSGTWNASESADWITISTTSGNNEDLLTVTVMENTSVQREGLITITSGTASATLSVIQSGTVGGEAYWQPATGGGIMYSVGNVGIGTTPDLTAKLTVKGDIKAERIDVVSSITLNGILDAAQIRISSDVPASDHVFNTNYKLLSLHELDQFIKTNKHLPEVPSATEFKENGYSVGEMDDLLLRKVEELTLYILEMKKLQDQLIEENKELNNKLLTD